MIVMAIAAALTKCPIASHNPNSSTQMTLPTSVPVPAPGFSTIVRPNGHNAYDAMRSAAKPKGMVTMSRKQTSAATGSRGPTEAAENQPDDVQDQAHISSTR